MLFLFIVISLTLLNLYNVNCVNQTHPKLTYMVRYRFFFLTGEGNLIVSVAGSDASYNEHKIKSFILFRLFVESGGVPGKNFFFFNKPAV